jgi:hypothetical protein
MILKNLAKTYSSRFLKKCHASLTGNFTRQIVGYWPQFVEVMENQVPPARNGEFQHKLTRLIFIREATRLALRRRWVRLIIRETLTVALYILFWKYAWVRWSLWVVMPLALLNLGMLSALT